MPRRDDAAYVEFVAASQQRLRRTAYLMTGDWQAAADATQEALIRVYVAWPRLDRAGGLPTYARRAVVSAVIDQARSGAARRRREDTVGTHASSPTTLPQDHLADRHLLIDALRQLPERQRACVVLRYFDDLTVADIAAALGCSEGTVKSQTSRGLDRLRQVLADLGHADLVGTLSEGESR